jgi:hypothetical protein
MPIRDDSNKIQQKKNSPNIPIIKVDLVYYFAIHKEYESKKEAICIEIIPPRARRFRYIREAFCSP